MGDRSHQQRLNLVPGELGLDEARDWIAQADRILIGAGAGLSASAGYDYADRESFARLFPALAQAGFKARYELVGYPLPPHVQWGFWAVHATDIRFGEDAAPVYQQLRELVGNREHFVVTSNVDQLFARNGFDPERVYTPQGDYGLYQCLRPCTRQVWDSGPVIRRALEAYHPETGATAQNAVPHCPNCGGAVYLNVNGGRWYIGDHFEPQGAAAAQWLGETLAANACVAVIEIGAGFNTPGVIRWPMERVTEAMLNARLIRISEDDSGVPADLASRAASLTGDATALLPGLAPLVERGAWVV